MENLAAYSDDDDGADNEVQQAGKSTAKAPVVELGQARLLADAGATASSSKIASPRREASRDVEEGASSSGAARELASLRPPPGKRKAQDGGWYDDIEWGLPGEEDVAHRGTVDETLQAKLAKFHELKRNGTHFNDSLARNRAFHNPHIYTKLVEWVDIDETASAFPDMIAWWRRREEEAQSGSQSYGDVVDTDRIWLASAEARRALKREGDAEKLAERQRQKMKDAEEARSRGQRSRIDFVSGGTEHGHSRSGGTEHGHSRSGRDDRKSAMPPVPRHGTETSSYREEVARRAQRIKDDLDRKPAHSSRRPSEDQHHRSTRRGSGQSDGYGADKRARR